MALYPISATLQKAYRDTLGIPSAPAYIDSEEKIVPVAIIANPSSTDVAALVRPTDGTDIIAINADGSLAAAKKYLNPDDMIRGQALIQGTTLTTVYNNTTGGTVYIDEIHCRWNDTNAASAGLLLEITESNGTTVVIILLDTRQAANTGLTGEQRQTVNVPIALENGRIVRTAGGVAGTIVQVNLIGHKTA